MMNIKKFAATIMERFRMTDKGYEFFVDPIIAANNGDGYMYCSENCKHLSSNHDECYLFRTKVNGMRRVQNCIGYSEGVS